MEGKSTSFPFVISIFSLTPHVSTLTFNSLPCDFPFSRYYFFDFIYLVFSRSFHSHDMLLEQFNIIHKSYHTIHIFWFIHVEQTFSTSRKIPKILCALAKYKYRGEKIIHLLYTCIINFSHTRYFLSSSLSLLLVYDDCKESPQWYIFVCIWFINYYVSMTYVPRYVYHAWLICWFELAYYKWLNLLPCNVLSEKIIFKFNKHQMYDLKN